jgi:Flp pilus assembly protein TadD
VKHRKEIAVPAPRRGVVLIALLSLLVVGCVIGVVSSLLGGDAPSSRSPSLVIARELIADGDYEAAERVLRHLDGDDAKALLGRLHLETGRWREAREELTEVLQRQPNHVEALRAMAEGCRDHGDAGLATRFYQRLCALRAKDARFWRELAKCARKSDSTLAMTAAQRALDLNPGDEEMTTVLSEGLGGESPATLAKRAPTPRTATRPEDLLPRVPGSSMPDSIQPGRTRY